MAIYREKAPLFDARKVPNVEQWEEWTHLMEWIDVETTQAVLNGLGEPVALRFLNGNRDYIQAVPGDWIVKVVDENRFFLKKHEAMVAEFELVEPQPEL